MVLIVRPVNRGVCGRVVEDGDHYAYLGVSLAVGDHTAAAAAVGISDVLSPVSWFSRYSSIFH